MRCSIRACKSGIGGIGGANGKHGMCAYMETQVVYMQMQ